ncbi:MAG: PIN domain-containing protein [Candidatus Binatia bacterium]
MTANAVLLDTNGWIALLNASDTLHAAADATWTRLGRRGASIVVTDWVVAETGNGLARTPVRARFVEAVEIVRTSPRATLLSITPTLAERAIALYASRPDKSWGLVDCASFVVMQDAGIIDAFTNDRHYEQAGFRALLPVL